MTDEHFMKYAGERCNKVISLREGSEEMQELAWMVSVLLDDIEKAEQELEESEQDNARLRGLIKQAEWEGYYGINGVCPWCGENPHSDCDAFTSEGEVK